MTSPASSSAHEVRSAAAPCPPTRDGALRQRIQPRSASGRTLSGSSATARQRSGMREHGHEPCRLDPLRRLDDNRDWILDVEPGARELDQDRASALEGEIVEIVPGDLAREHLPAAPQVEPQGGDLGAHLGERLRVETVALGRSRVVIPGGVRVRRREQDLGARLVGEAAELKALLDRGGAVVARRDNVRVDIDETGHASTIAAASRRRPAYSAATKPRIRSTACSRFSSEEAYEMRRCPSPWPPNEVPESTATPASSSRRSASSSAPIGRSDTFGNA